MMIWLIVLLTSVLPLFFFPALTNPVFMGKNFFLAASVLLILAVAITRLVRAKKLTYTIAVLDFLVILFLAVNFVSWIFLSPGGKAKALVQPLGLGTVVFLTLLYFVIVQTKVEEKMKKIMTGLMISAAIVSFISLILFVTPGVASLPLGKYLPWVTGSVPAILVQFLGILALFSVFNLVREARKENVVRWWMALLTVVVLVGAGINGYQFAKQKGIFLDWFSSWAVSVESFKRKPLLGVGPAGFDIAFNRWRPPEFNQTASWNLRFNAPHSWVLQVWTELGILGLVVLFLIFANTAGSFKKNGAGKLLVLNWLALLIFPGNLLTIFLFFVTLALVRGKGTEKIFSLSVGETGRDVSPIVGGVMLTVLTIFLGFFAYKSFAAETVFYQAIKAAAEGKGGETYNLQVKAINQAKNIINYRISFSQTNFALANVLASKGDQLTEEEKNQVSQLLSQAVSEAKAAVALEPTNVVAWENLAQIYRQIIGVVSGADQWAISAYQQAVALDSLNPRLRVDYGGLFYGMAGYEAASRQFEMAVSLKADYANAWYNWAWTSKQQKNLNDAVQKMQQAVNLVEVGSPDYERAFKELEDWKKELGTGKETATEEEPKELIKPEPIPSPRLEEPIILPEEAAPPSPVPTEPESEPTAIPTVSPAE